jgi:hypothetical protein
MLHMCITCIASVLPECCKPPPLEDEIQLEADRLRSQEACFPHVARNVPCVSDVYEGCFKCFVWMLKK